MAGHRLTSEEAKQARAKVKRPGPMPNDARALFIAHGPACAKLLKAIVDSAEEDTRDRINAAREILDRGFGKPKESLELIQPEAQAELTALRAELAAILARRVE